MAGLLPACTAAGAKRAIAVDFKYPNGRLLKEVPIRYFEP
jgi:hypothetical protein